MKIVLGLRGICCFVVFSTVVAFCLPCDASILAVKLSKNSITMHTGRSQMLSACVVLIDGADNTRLNEFDSLPSESDNASDGDEGFTWSSSDPSIASVDQNGLVTAQAIGTCKITVSCSGVSIGDTCNLTVAATNFLTKIPTRLIKFAAHNATETQFQLVNTSVDYSMKRLEDSTLKVQVVNDKFAGLEYRFTHGLDLNDEDGIALSFYCPDVSGSPEPYVHIAYSNTDKGNMSDPQDQMSHGIYFGKVRNGWNYIRLRADDGNTASKEGPTGLGWAAMGSGSTIQEPVHWLRIEFYHCLGKTFYVEGLYRGGSTRPKICWMFDSWNNINGNRVNALFSSYGWKWGLDVPDEYLIGDTYSAYETALLYGAEPVLNDVKDRSLLNFTQQETEDMIAQNRALFDARGWNYDPRFFAYNNNQYNDAVVAGLSAAGIEWARAGVNELWLTQHEQGLANPYRLGARSMDNKVFSTLKQWVDRIIQYQCSAILYQHELVDGGDGNPVTGSSVGPGGLRMYTNDFRALAAYIRQRELDGDVDVVGPREWYDGVMDSAIYIPAASVVLDSCSLCLQKGMSKAIIASVLPANATSKKIKWISSNPAVAMVDDQGNVTAIDEGKCVITATVEKESVSASCDITVFVPSKATYTVSSTVCLGDYVGEIKGIPIEVKLLQPDKHSVIRTVNTTLDADGKFYIEDVPNGTYYFAIKPSHWLRKTTGPVVVDGNDVDFVIR